MFSQSIDTRDQNPKASCRRGRGWHRSASGLLFVVVFVAALGPGRPAQAYLDPGTGSILLQVVIGGVAGLGVVVKLYWHRLRSLFGLREKEAQKEPPPAVK